jgi:hypothetical protein
MRRILSAFCILRRHNSKTNSSIPTHPYPDSNPNSKNPNPDTNSDPDTNPNPNSYPNILETLQQTLNLDLHGKPLSYSTAKSGSDRLLWTIAEAEEILCLILSGTILPIAYHDIPVDRLRDIVYLSPTTDFATSPTTDFFFFLCLLNPNLQVASSSWQLFFLFPGRKKLNIFGVISTAVVVLLP